MMATPKDVADVLEAKRAASARRQEQEAAAARIAAEKKAAQEAAIKQANELAAARYTAMEKAVQAGTYGKPVTAATTTVTTSTAATSTAATSTAATSTATTSTATSTATTSTATTSTATTSTPIVDPLAQLQKDSMDAARLDAFKLLEDVFNGYGLGELVPEIRKYMQGNIGPNEATLLLKSTAAYQNRFKGNQERLAKGLNVYDEADYIRHENEYAELFKQYGVTQFANKAEFAQLIGNDITKVDLNERLKLAVINVQNADPNIKAALKQYYPNITDADLVSYFLKPDQTLQSLQLKVSTADVAAAAKAQGLQVSGLTTEDQRARAEQIATILGPSSPEDVLAAARAGYEKVARVLPFAAKLSEIYGAQTSAYGQTQAETEFLLSDAEAARKRAGLSALEEAQFSGRSGIDTQINPLGRSIQGAF